MFCYFMSGVLLIFIWYGTSKNEQIPFYLPLKIVVRSLVNASKMIKHYLILICFQDPYIRRIVRTKKRGHIVCFLFLALAVSIALVNIPITDIHFLI